MAIPFVSHDFHVPSGLKTDQFRLEPLGAQHNERDHQAWMSSIEHICNTPGFPTRNWPASMSLEQNLADLEGHAQDFNSRTGFTYSVVNKDEIIGCVYIYPARTDSHDAWVKSWVTASRAELDVILWRVVSIWLADVWPFERIDYASR